MGGLLTARPRAIAGALGVAGCGLALGACGEAVSTSSFKGESHGVAQTVSSFQKDATAGDQSKLCEQLAVSVTSRLKAGGGCEAVLKQQLREIDALDLKIESISVSGASARARVKSTWSGKSAISTLLLVKEAGRWRISGAQ